MSVVWEGPDHQSLHLELADDHVEVIVRTGDGVLFQHAHVRVPVSVFWDWLDSAMDLLPKGLL